MSKQIECVVYCTGVDLFDNNFNPRKWHQFVYHLINNICCSILLNYLGNGKCSKAYMCSSNILRLFKFVLLSSVPMLFKKLSFCFCVALWMIFQLIISLFGHKILTFLRYDGWNVANCVWFWSQNWNNIHKIDWLLMENSRSTFFTELHKRTRDPIGVIFMLNHCGIL